MATLQDVLKENKELQKKQNTTTVAPIGNPASPYNKAVQTGNPNVQAGRQKISVTPTAQKQTYTTPLQAQTAASKKAVDLVGNAIGSGASQTVQMGSSLLKGVPKVAETGARIVNNVFGDAPVSPMTAKLTPSEIDDNSFTNQLARALKSEDRAKQTIGVLANGLLGYENEQQTVELPKTEQDVTKNQFRNIANKELIAQGETPVRQITEWSDPWSDALSQNVENVQDFGQRYNQAVRPVTDTLDKAVEGINNYTNTNFAQNLNPAEQFVTQAIGGALPNLARNKLLGALSGGSQPVLRVLSDAAMFIPSFYEGLVDGQAKGLSAEEAMLNAIVRGSIETGTEQMFDTWKMTGGGMGLDEFLIDKIAMSNASPFLKSFIKNAASIFLESNEDVASSFLNSLADAGFYGQELNLKDMTTGMLQEGTASAMSTFVMGLLTGEFSSNSFRNFQAYSDYLKNKTNDKLDIYDDSQKFKTETALLYASMNDEEKAQLLAQTQQEMAKRFGADDDIARMDLQELKDYADRAAEKQIMGLTEEQYAAYIDDMNGTSEPVATVTVKGQPYDVYEYLGVRTPDQDRAMDIAERLGVKAYIVEDLPGGQNAQKMGDGTILISANAKRPAKALIFHEIFHKLRSDGTWNELLDLAFTNMTKEVGYERYVEDMVAKYVPYYGSVDDNYLKGVALSKESTEKKKTKIHDYLVKQGVNQYYADPDFHNRIDEEIAAEFLERFNNEDTIKAMYNRSGDVFERMWQDLKDSVQNFTGVLTKEEQELKKAERLFANVANQAKEEQQKAEDKLLRNGYNFHQEDGTLYSVGYSTAAENLANVDRAQLVKDIVTASNGAITEERADEFVRNEEVMAMSIKDTALDFEAEPGETAIKSNTDYPQGTIDLTNNCTKRRPITFMTNRLQEALPDDLFTADDYADIRLIMMDDGRVVACGLCFVEDRRKQLGEIAQNFRDEWANSEDGYLWRSNSSGKRIKVSIGEDLAKRYGVNPGEVTVNDLNMRQVDFGSSDSWHKFQKEHPYEAAAFEAFNNARGQNAGRLLVPRAEYKREILYWSPEKVKAVNDLGGLRIFSFSDFESIHMLDIIQIIEDCAARGVMIQGYTKQPNFAKLVRNTGIKLNRSLIPYGATGLKMVNGKWVLAMNTSEGMDIQSKDFLDETDNPNVGNNITGINDRQIHVAMTDDFIHYIIPFHTGKSNKANLRLGVGKWDNYKDYQTDKSLSPEDTRRLALRTSELKAQGVADTEAYKKAMKELEIKPTKGKMINIYTEVLSDPSVTDVVSFQNKFFDVCYEKGIIPRFSQFLDTDQYGNYVYTPGYEKMLVDFKLFDRDGNVLKQEIVRPDFDKGFMQQVIDEDLKKTEEERQGADYPQELYDKVLNYIRVKHGYDGDYQAYEELKNKIDKNVTQLNSDNESVQGYALSPSVTNSLMELNVQRPTINDKYSQFASPAAAYSLSDDELDRLYFDALEREGNESPEARRLLNERANERGYTDRAYHGTQQFGFTVPDTQYSDDKLSFFATDDPTTAGTYSGNEYVRPISGNVAEAKQNEAKRTVDNLASLYPEDFPYDSNELWDVLMGDALRAYDEWNGDEVVIRKWLHDDLADWREEAFDGNAPESVLNAENDVIEAIQNYVPTSYAEDSTNGIYDLVINPEGLLDVDANNSNWNRLLLNPEDIGTTENDAFFDEPYRDTRDLVEFAEYHGYPGYRLRNVYDDGGYGEGLDNSATVYALFNPQSQVKSMDTITYDDEGNIIPPSQRYNRNNPDIRYSLSDEQEEYFKDSKIRDEDGNLIPVYHGTMEDFTVFDRSKGRSTMDIQGMFFSPWEIDAGGYGDNVGEYYLNITNPASEAQGYAALRRFQGQNNAGVKAREYLESLGYDGVNNGDEEYIAFYPEQIKRTDNLKPTKNPDVRFSAEEYIPESIDQANKYPDRRYQQTKGDMKVLGDIDRENNNTEDPERTQDVRPETFIPPFEPSDIKSYNELFEDGHEERNPNKEELEFYQSLNEKLEKGKGGNSAGGAIGFLTPDQYFDHAVGRNTEQRKILDEKFGRPMFDAKKGYTQNIREKNDGLKQIVEETGIYGGTDESAAVQWYGEGQKPIGDNKVKPYTLDDLKRDFPEKWEDIVKMEQYMRKQYDEYVDRWNAILTQIYPHPERMLLRNLNSWRQQLDKLRSELELTDPNDIALVEDYRKDIAKLEQKIADGEDAYRSGDYLRNKRLIPRKDYFHHIREVETNGFGNVKNILQAITQATGKGNIDPDLVDVSQYTQPRTKWSGLLQHRNSNEYTADAVTSFARYVNEAEYAIAMNPVISQYRDEISKIRKATKQTKNANTMIDYLAKYTNDLAGKTNYLDTAMREFLGGEGNRNALLTAVEAINRRGKANAVVGNLRSAIAQFYNIPNALSVIKSLPAWRKGFNDYMAAKAGNRELLDQSPFLAERYGGLNEKDFQARDTVWKQIEGKLSDFSSKMMEFGDREATELIWLSAYNEGIEKGVDDPVYYADSMARRAVGGRGIGEVPFGMNSRLVGLFAPFQVEANNQWQNLKGMIEDKDAEGIFRLMLGSYLMNILARAIFNDGVLPDPLEALEEGIRRLLAKDREDSVGQIMGDTAKRVAGETVSMIPGTSLWLPLVMGDNAETFFGDSDPTRYGTGTVGVKNLFDVAADAINGDGFDAVTPLLNLGLPYGGKQVSRMYNTLQDLNVLPSNGFMNTPFGGEKNPTAGSYSNAGALRYQLPNEVDSAQDIVEIARALAFGSNSTDAAQEYFNNGNKPVLSKERVAKLREHPEVSAESYITYLKEAGTDDKQGISQQEAYDWLSSHNLSDEERNALWEMTSSSWKKSYDEYQPKETKEEPKEETPKEEKKEEKQNTQKSGNPTNKKEFTAVADSDGNGSLKQAEAYAWLNDQKLSDAEKEALWNLMGWKTDYETYASKH